MLETLFTKIEEDPSLIIEVPRNEDGTFTRVGPIRVYVATKKKVLRNWRNQPKKITWLDPKPLPSYGKHSPDGFNLGYGGSGPAELAYSICVLFGAESWYQMLKTELVAKLNRKDQTIPLKHIRLMLESFKMKGKLI